jgi:hypothetical protein
MIDLRVSMSLGYDIAVEIGKGIIDTIQFVGKFIKGLFK